MCIYQGGEWLFCVVDLAVRWFFERGIPPTDTLPHIFLVLVSLGSLSHRRLCFLSSGDAAKECTNSIFSSVATLGGEVGRWGTEIGFQLDGDGIRPTCGGEGRGRGRV